MLIKYAVSKVVLEYAVRKVYGHQATELDGMHQVQV